MPKRTPVYIDKERLMCYLFDIQLEDFDLMREICHFPEEDVAKVVHCRDCKYEDPCGLPPDSESTFCRYSSHLLIQFPKNGFCSYGIRKEGSGENPEAWTQTQS